MIGGGEQLAEFELNSGTESITTTWYRRKILEMPKRVAKTPSEGWKMRNDRCWCKSNLKQYLRAGFAAAASPGRAMATPRRTSSNLDD
eukprot:scaffold239655_cov56-Cyclotella_meneghiniana.AAC.1